MKKKGFTLVELIAVIGIIAILLIFLVPNIMKFSDMSRISMRASKVRTMEAAAEQFGNDLINRFQRCTNESTLDELKNQCSIKATDLITGGYLESDDEDNNILDPESNDPMNGDILICYNPVQIAVYANYVEEDDGYSCMDISADAKASLNLSHSAGVSYIGADEFTIGIIKSGSFKTNGFTCTSSDEELATCSLDGTRNLKIKVTATETDKEFEEVILTLKATTDEGAILQKKYTLKIYPTELNVDYGDAYEVCMKPGETLKYPVNVSNTGMLEVSSSDEDILMGNYDKENGLLIMSAQEKYGIAEISLREKNGNKSVSLEKRVYVLGSDGEFPEGMLLGSSKEVKINFGGNDSIKVESSNSAVIKVHKKNETPSEELTLESDEPFFLEATGIGEANITVTGNPCGEVTYKIVVQNIYVEDHEIELFVDGKPATTKIVSGSKNTYSCTSENSSIVSCSVDGDELILKPGGNPSYDDGVDVTITGANGGGDVVNVVVRNVTIGTVDEENQEVTKVCVDRATGVDEKKVFVKGENLGELSISAIDPIRLGTARMTIGNEVLFERKSTDDTGIVKVEVSENHAGKKKAIDYYIYDLQTDRQIVDLKTADTIEIKIDAFATGVIGVYSEDSDVASVSVRGTDDFSYDLNSQNEYVLNVRGNKVGNTNIVVKGKDCGELIIPVRVSGHTFSINLEKGDFVDWISDGTYEVKSLSCSTLGEAVSCDVTFPSIIVNEHYEKMGFSKEKRHNAKGYAEGETITLDAQNDKEVYYANVTEHTAPVCKIKDHISGNTVGKVSRFTLFCVEVDSGLTDKKIEIDDFILSDDVNNRVVSVGEGVEIRDSNNYKIGKEYEVEIYSDIFNQYELGLKAGAVVDNCENENEETSFGTFLASDSVSMGHWYIGKDTPENIMAILYSNDNIKEGETVIEGIDGATLSSGKYTLVLYGEGEMKDFGVDEESMAPWIREGFQTLISNVIVKEGITSIGKLAFNNMRELKSVVFSEGLKLIREDAFSYSGLTSITLPSTMETIELNSFYDNRDLVELNLNEGLATIGQTAFIGHAISELEIPSTVTEIKGRSFASGEDFMPLKKLNFASNSQLITINERAFANNQIKDLHIPESVRIIGALAFAVPGYKYSTLENLTFGDDSQLFFINDQAFDYNRLNSLSLPNSLEQIGNAAFRGTRDNVTSVHIGPNVNSIGSLFVTGSNIREFTVDDANTSFTAQDGILYNKSMTNLVRFPDAYYKTHTSYTVPDSIKTINNYAFYGWYENHDSGTKFVVNLPSGLNNMNAGYNFHNFVCSEINIDSDKYKSSDGIVYNSDKTILYKVPPLYASTSFTIPDTVKTIELAALAGNNTIRTLTVPDSVTTIARDAFYTDTNYALQNIHLDMNDVDIKETTFGAYVFVGDSKDLATRNIYVKNSTLKAKLENVTVGNIEVMIE